MKFLAILFENCGELEIEAKDKKEALKKAKKIIEEDNMNYVAKISITKEEKE